MQRERLVTVRIEPRTPERRPKESGMDGDDGAQAARRPASDHDVLMLRTREALDHPIGMCHILAAHDRILRRARLNGPRRGGSRLWNAPTNGQDRGASTVKALVERAASLLPRPASVPPTGSTKVDPPCRTIRASARAGPTTTGERK